MEMPISQPSPNSPPSVKRVEDVYKRQGRSLPDLNLPLQPSQGSNILWRRTAAAADQTRSGFDPVSYTHLDVYKRQAF